MAPRPLTATLALALALSLPARAADVTVQMVDFDFEASIVAIDPGDDVLWENDSGMIHSATAMDGSWDSGFVNPGAEAAVTFGAAGKHDYFCLPHLGSMYGSVVVGGNGFQVATAPDAVFVPLGTALGIDVAIFNHTQNTGTGNLFFSRRELPDGPLVLVPASELNVAVNPLSGSIGPGARIDLALQWTPTAPLPAGDHEFTAYVGVFPNQVLDSHAWSITVF